MQFFTKSRAEVSTSQSHVPEIHPQTTEFVFDGDGISLRLSLWDNCVELTEQHVFSIGAADDTAKNLTPLFDLYVGGTLVEHSKPPLQKNGEQIFPGELFAAAVSRQEIVECTDIAIRRTDRADITPGVKALHYQAIHDPKVKTVIEHVEGAVPWPQTAPWKSTG